MNIEQLHQHFLSSSGISTDTRKIIPNSLYFALKGERFDGNTFAEEAVKKGASLAVVDDPTLKGDKFYTCKDVLSCLQQLANYHRRYLAIPIIAITGSNGKTTTKKLIYSVLSQAYKAKATQGNLNNHIGVPLTLLSFDQDTEIGIVEMGANHQKEIEALCQIAAPNFGYITNYGKAHLEGFGGIQGVIKGKSEMYVYLEDNQGIAFVNADDALQLEKSINNHCFTFGAKNANCNVVLVSANPNLVVKYDEVNIESNLVGAYNFRNIRSAIGIGHYFKVPIDKIKKGIENFSTENNRSQVIKQGTNTILLDAYNANPTSMLAALESFVSLDDNKKVVILGDMFEIGEDTLKEHVEIIQQVKKLNFDLILICGDTFYKANSTLEEKVRGFLDFHQLAEFLKQHPIQDRSILIKGSRVMALERCLPLL